MSFTIFPAGEGGGVGDAHEARVSDLNRGKIDRFSMDPLVRLAVVNCAVPNFPFAISVFDCLAFSQCFEHPRSLVVDALLQLVA